MAWVRLHDGAMQNEKIIALSDSAFRLWVRGLCFCQTALNDGLISRQALRELGARRKDIQMLSTPQVVGRAPLWEPHLGGFQVHDYLRWNDCREKVVARQEKARQRKEAWEARHSEEQDTECISERVLNTVRNGEPNQTKPLRIRTS